MGTLTYPTFDKKFFYFKVFRSFDRTLLEIIRGEESESEARFSTPLPLPGKPANINELFVYSKNECTIELVSVSVRPSVYAITLENMNRVS